MADNQNNGHTEVLDPYDSLYIRVQDISSDFISFYEMLASNEPAKLQEIEDYFNKYPKAAQAKMRVAPVVLSKVLPARKQVAVIKEKPKKALPAKALQGVDTDQLRQLAGIDDASKE